MELKTPVSALQEHLIRQKKIPTYELIQSGVGTHNPEFVFRVRVNDVWEDGKGKSKQEAKHKAAEKMLKTLNITEGTNETVLELLEEGMDIGENYVGMLKEFCFNQSYPSPVYNVEEEAGPAHCKAFKMSCNVSKLYECGISRTKKMAKQIAAFKMLNHVKKLCRNKNNGEDVVDATVDEAQLKKTYTTIPPMKCSMEDIIKKQTSIKSNYLLPVKERFVYYKDHEKAYIGLSETSATLLSVVQRICSIEDNSLDVISKIVTELGAKLTSFKGTSADDSEVIFLVVSGDNEWPPISGFGFSEEEAALSLLYSLRDLCTE